MPASWDGEYIGTAYGPPWDGPNGMEGSGITSQGTKLSPTVQKKMTGPYIIASDPKVIPYGSLNFIWPNPFNYMGLFRMDDTGGMFHGQYGRKVDFYDPLGREHQNNWGERKVRVMGFNVKGSNWRKDLIDQADIGDVAKFFGVDNERASKIISSAISSNRGLIGDIGGAIGGVFTAPVDAVKDAANGVSDVVSAVASKLGSGEFWINVAKVVGGFLLLAIGVVRMTGVSL